MSREAIDVSRAAFEQFSRGDFSAYANLLDEFELVLAPEMPDAGTYRGAAAREWATAWVDSFERMTQEPIEFLDARRRPSLRRVHSTRLDSGKRCPRGDPHVVGIDREGREIPANAAVSKPERRPRSRRTVGVGGDPSQGGFRNRVAR